MQLHKQIKINNLKAQVYNKGQLVLAVIKDYCENNPNITYSALQNSFPNTLQGRETFTDLDTAKSKSRIRNFIKPNEVITLSDGVSIAVSNQWGIGNINNFIDHIKTFNPPYIITEQS